MDVFTKSATNKEPSSAPHEKNIEISNFEDNDD